MAERADIKSSKKQKVSKKSTVTSTFHDDDEATFSDEVTPPVEMETTSARRSTVKPSSSATYKASVEPSKARLRTGEESKQ